VIPVRARPAGEDEADEDDEEEEEDEEEEDDDEEDEEEEEEAEAWRRRMILALPSGRGGAAFTSSVWKIFQVVSWLSTISQCPVLDNKFFVDEEDEEEEAKTLRGGSGSSNPTGG